MTLLRHYRRYPRPALDSYHRFLAGGRHVGWVKPGFAWHLRDYPEVFTLAAGTVALADGLATPEARSLAMAQVLADLRERGLVPGWRGELYPVARAFHAAPLLLMERAAAPLFGVKSYGVNLNGFTGRGWQTKMWIARRAEAKAIDPGKLDVMVGGGLPAGLSPLDCLVKECGEEAGLPEALAREAQPVGVTSFMIEAEEGLRVALQFNFDLELPEDFVPTNADGEVAAFELVAVNDLLRCLREGEDFMFDVALVAIDFLVRHGFIGPEESDYLPLLAGLRQDIPFQP